MVVVVSQPRSSDECSSAPQRWHRSAIHVWTNAPFRTIRKIPVCSQSYAERLSNSSLATLTYNYTMYSNFTVIYELFGMTNRTSCESLIRMFACNVRLSVDVSLSLEHWSQWWWWWWWYSRCCRRWWSWWKSVASREFCAIH